MNAQLRELVATCAVGMPLNVRQRELILELAALAAAGDAVVRLQAFKDFVHRRLDEMGVPVDPESPHKAAGCRIGGRLDYVEARLAAPSKEAGDVLRWPAGATKSQFFDEKGRFVGSVTRNFANPPGDQRQEGAIPNTVTLAEMRERRTPEQQAAVDAARPRVREYIADLKAASPPTDAAAAVGEDLLDSLIGSSRDDERNGLPLMSPTTALFRKRLIAALSPTASAARESQPAAAEVDWRGHFVNESAMRYMDNGVPKDRAFACAEHDATALAAIKGDSHAG